MHPFLFYLVSLFLFFNVWYSLPSQAALSPTPTIMPVPSSAALPETTPTTIPTTALPPVTVLSPQAGQAVLGNVVIQGTSRTQNFKSAELSFAYANNPTGTWFLITLLDTPVVSATLGTWDTTTMTDGTYDLRLSITREDGSQAAIVVKGLRVRNYTPIETSTPTPLTPTATPLPGELPTATSTLLPTITPTPTALPPNPAGLVPTDIALSVGKGALGVAGFFALMGAYALMRKVVRSKT